jgi:multidrug resistance efflux pump
MQLAPDLPSSNPPIATRTFPATGVRVVVFSLVAFAAGIGAAFWLSRLKFERFPGYLQARLQTVTAGREARIARILVTPGTIVTAGQPLVVLEDKELEQTLAARRQEIESLEIELSRSRAALEVELDIQRRDILDRIFETKWRLAQLQRQPVSLADESPLAAGIAGRWKNGLPPVVVLVERPSLIFGNAQHLELASVVKAEPVRQPETIPTPVSAEMALCGDHIAQLEKMSRELPEKISRSMGVDLAQARLDHARSLLAALEQQKTGLTLVAESAGMIGVFHKQAGDRVTANEPIVQLLDEEQPYVLLQIPSPRISDFAPGTIVDLRFPGGEKGKGRVETIPPQTSDLPEETGARQETIITAQIDPAGKLWPSIPFGSVVEVRRRR